MRARAKRQQGQPQGSQQPGRANRRAPSSQEAAGHEGQSQQSLARESAELPRSHERGKRESTQEPRGRAASRASHEGEQEERRSSHSYWVGACRPWKCCPSPLITQSGTRSGSGRMWRPVAAALGRGSLSHFARLDRIAVQLHYLGEEFAHSNHPPSTLNYTTTATSPVVQPAALATGHQGACHEGRAPRSPERSSHEGTQSVAGNGASDQGQELPRARARATSIPSRAPSS